MDTPQNKSERAPAQRRLVRRTVTEEYEEPCPAPAAQVEGATPLESAATAAASDSAPTTVTVVVERTECDCVSGDATDD